MSRADRSLAGAHNALRDTAHTLPRLASVRLLHVESAKRHARRERRARAIVITIMAALPAALFYFGSF